MAYKFDGKTMSWAIQTKGNALAFLDKSEMNKVVRVSMTLAGKDWGNVFLPKRFSHYIERKPFPYPGHTLGFYYSKARRMGIVAGIVMRLNITKGWDPWSTEKPDLPLIQEWKKLNPGKYNFKDRLFGSGLIADMRRNAKRAVMEIIDEMWGDGKFVPLIESGKTRDMVTTNVKYRATATSNTQTLRITMPRPYYAGGPKAKGGSSPTVNAVLGTMPGWEISWFAQKLVTRLTEVLASQHGLSQGAGGMVTQRARTDYQTTQNQRAYAATGGR